MSLFSLISGKRMKAFEGIPGPKPAFPLGNLGGFLWDMMIEGKQPWEICAAYGEEFGGLTVIWFGPFMPVLVLNDAELIGEVLVERPRDFYKQVPVSALMPVVTKNNPFVLNGKPWRQAREHDPFSADWFPDWLASRAPVIAEYAAERAEALAQAGQVDLMKTFQKLTFDIFSMAVFGRELPRGRYRDFIRMANSGSLRIKTSLPRLPPPLNPFFYLSRARWQGFFQELVDEARVNPDPKATDLVQVTLRQGTPLTGKQLALAMGNIYFGGAFSAASAMVTNLYLLSQDDTALKKVREQLDPMMKEPLTNEALTSCDELDRALWESLRLLAPVPFYGRNSVRGCEVKLGDRMVPSNTTIFISNWRLQRDGGYWADGLSYRPQRWDGDTMETNPIGSGWFFPFGRGERMCMGRFFAMLTMKASLAAFWSKLDVKITGAYKQGYYFGVMMPRGLKAVFSKR